MNREESAAANAFIEQLKRGAMEPETKQRPAQPEPSKGSVTHVTINRAQGCTFIFNDYRPQLDQEQGHTPPLPKPNA